LVLCLLSLGFSTLSNDNNSSSRRKKELNMACCKGFISLLLSSLLIATPIFATPIFAIDTGSISGSGGGIDFLAGSPLIPASVLLSGVPECTFACGSPLLAAIARSYQFPVNAAQAFNHLCEEYELAVQCVRHSEVPVCQAPNYFDVITAGIKWSCIDFRQDFNDLYTVLGAAQPGINQECSMNCGIEKIAKSFDSVTEEMPGALMRSMEDPEDALRQNQLKNNLDILCTGVKCVLDCSSAKIDDMLPGFGDVFQKLTRLPWEVTGQQLRTIRSGPLRMFFNTIIPKSCWVLTEPVPLFEFSGESSGSGDEASGNFSGLRADYAVPQDYGKIESSGESMASGMDHALGAEESGVVSGEAASGQHESSSYRHGRAD